MAKSKRATIFAGAKGRGVFSLKIVRPNNYALGGPVNVGGGITGLICHL